MSQLPTDTWVTATWNEYILVAVSISTIEMRSE
ncbi:hypothetical protein Ple7327_3294 [Pleurocapsa sp. PCC 7327]|nr:hypothetical protein Ple7327_3294 [Pleurocapsa sp. PCC 7327]